MHGSLKSQMRDARSILVRGGADLEEALDLVVEAEQGDISVLFVATGVLSGERLVAEWYRSSGDLASDPIVLDVGGTVRSAVSDTSMPADMTSIIQGVDGDLASAECAVETFLAEHDNSERVVVIVDSLSSLLEVDDVSAAVLFLDGLFDVLGNDDVGYVLLDRDADLEVADAFRPLFDVTVDVDSDEGDVALRSPPSLVPPDTAYDLLTPLRRRHVLRTLLAVPGPLPLDDLAGELAAVEEFPDRERCQILLTHVDVPKLRNAGVIRYDAEANVIEALPLATGLQPYLVLADQYDDEQWGAERDE